MDGPHSSLVTSSPLPLSDKDPQNLNSPPLCSRVLPLPLSPSLPTLPHHGLHSVPGTGQVLTQLGGASLRPNLLPQIFTQASSTLSCQAQTSSPGGFPRHLLHLSFSHHSVLFLQSTHHSLNYLSIYLFIACPFPPETPRKAGTSSVLFTLSSSTETCPAQSRCSGNCVK